MVEPAQGEIWWATLDKSRPVLIVTRSEAAAVLNRLVVAPVSRTIRDIPTEIAVGRHEGLPHEGAASFDNLQVVLRRALTQKAGRLDPSHPARICRALEALADC